MKIQIEKLTPTQFNVLLDGSQGGQYETEAKAKANARRFFPPRSRIKWNRCKDGILFGVSSHWARRIGESF